ncbi:TPA: DUF2607 family protein [Vibrio diabolicus]
MYHHQQKIRKHWHRTVLFFSVTLLIAWNFAVILHQVDLTPEHHTHHHCQLFSGVQHGIAKAQPTLSTPTFTRIQYHDVFQRLVNSEDIRGAARAPPYFA